MVAIDDQGCCLSHPFVQLQRLSPRTGEWKALLDTCPLCAMDNKSTSGSVASSICSALISMANDDEVDENPFVVSNHDGRGNDSPGSNNSSPLRGDAGGRRSSSRGRGRRSEQSSPLTERPRSNSRVRFGPPTTADESSSSPLTALVSTSSSASLPAHPTSPGDASFSGALSTLGSSNSVYNNPTRSNSFYSTNSIDSTASATLQQQQLTKSALKALPRYKVCKKKMQKQLDESEKVTTMSMDLSIDDTEEGDSFMEEKSLGGASGDGGNPFVVSTAGDRQLEKRNSIGNPYAVIDKDDEEETRTVTEDGDDAGTDFPMLPSLLQSHECDDGEEQEESRSASDGMIREGGNNNSSSNSGSRRPISQPRKSSSFHGSSSRRHRSKERTSSSFHTAATTSISSGSSSSLNQHQGEPKKRRSSSCQVTGNRHQAPPPALSRPDPEEYPCVESSTQQQQPGSRRLSRRSRSQQPNRAPQRSNSINSHTSRNSNVLPPPPFQTSLMTNLQASPGSNSRSSSSHQMNQMVNQQQQGQGQGYPQSPQQQSQHQAQFQHQPPPQMQRQTSSSQSSIPSQPNYTNMTIQPTSNYDDEVSTLSFMGNSVGSRSNSVQSSPPPNKKNNGGNNSHAMTPHPEEPTSNNHASEHNESYASSYASSYGDITAHANNLTTIGTKDAALVVSINTNEYDSKGRCIHHAHIKLRKKKLFGRGWKVLMSACPDCCVDELRRIRAVEENKRKMKEKLDRSDRSSSNNRGSGGSLKLDRSLNMSDKSDRSCDNRSVSSGRSKNSNNHGGQRRRSSSRNNGSSMPSSTESNPQGGGSRASIVSAGSSNESPGSCTRTPAGSILQASQTGLESFTNTATPGGNSNKPLLPPPPPRRSPSVDSYRGGPPPRRSPSVDSTAKYGSPHQQKQRRSPSVDSTSKFAHHPNHHPTTNNRRMSTNSLASNNSMNRKVRRPSVETASLTSSSGSSKEMVDLSISDRTNGSSNVVPGSPGVVAPSMQMQQQPSARDATPTRKGSGKRRSKSKSKGQPQPQQGNMSNDPSQQLQQQSPSISPGQQERGTIHVRQMQYTDPKTNLSGQYTGQVNERFVPHGHGSFVVDGSNGEGVKEGEWKNGRYRRSNYRNKGGNTNEGSASRSRSKSRDVAAEQQRSRSRSRSTPRARSSSRSRPMMQQQQQQQVAV